MRLKVTLSQPHKSFEQGFSCDLEGNLIILSGVNGSGKSQLLEIIQRRPFQQPQSLINAQVSQDGVDVRPSEVILRSFKENVNIQELSQASPQNFTNMYSQVWNFYNQYALNEENFDVIQQGLADSAHRARLRLIEAFGPDRFNTGALTMEDVKRGLPPEFAWRQNDSFTNEIGEIFFAFCIRRREVEAEAGRTGQTVDYGPLGKEPWLELNDLFAELNLDYRFKTDFELTGVEINDQPRIFHADGSGLADPSRPRNLSELSDGEKAIISLCFASLRRVAPNETKILLLDEFDSTLNPSLTEMFFTVVQRFFVERDVQTIVVTHSIATLSLAPPEASFYEVYKPSIGGNKRILEVERANYAELGKVTRTFQSSLADQSARFDKIEAQNDELVASVAALRQQIDELQTPVIVTEGPTDVCHFRAAMYELRVDAEIAVQFFDQSSVPGGMSSSKLERFLENIAIMPNARRVIGIFDRDEPSIVRKIGDGYSYGNNVYAFCVSLPEFREGYEAVCVELLYKDHDIRKEHDGKRLFFTNEIATEAARGGAHAKPRVYVVEANPASELTKSIYDKDVVTILKDGVQVAHSKSTFAKLVKDDAEFRSGFDFSGFKPVFEQIKATLDLQ